MTQPSPNPVLDKDGIAINEQQGGYPYWSGDHIILGPECFASKDKLVICWKGVNYYAPMDSNNTPEKL